MLPHPHQPSHSQHHKITELKGWLEGVLDSWSPVTQKLKGNEKQFELAWPQDSCYACYGYYVDHFGRYTYSTFA